MSGYNQTNKTQDTGILFKPFSRTDYAGDQAVEQGVLGRKGTD